jgi:antitoxin MazE
MVRAKLVKIGNSRGIRLAKPLLEVAGLVDEVEIEATPGLLTIRPSIHPRAGWAEAAEACGADGLRKKSS